MAKQTSTRQAAPWLYPNTEADSTSLYTTGSDAYFSIYAIGGTVSVPTAAATPLPFGTAIYGTKAAEIVQTAISTWTPATPGVYVVWFSGNWASSAAGTIRSLTYYVNGAPSAYDTIETNIVAGSLTQNLIAPVVVSAGQTFTFVATQDTGGNLDLVSPRVAILRII